MNGELLRISKRIKELKESDIVQLEESVKALENRKHGIVDTAAHDNIFDFGRTSFSSGVATVLTGLTGADLEATVWEVSVVANPNVNGSGEYSSITTGHLAITRRYDGSNSVDWYVYFTQLAQFLGGSNAPLAISVNLDGMSHVDYPAAQLRILVSGFSSNADPGSMFKIRMRKIQ